MIGVFYQMEQEDDFHGFPRRWTVDDQHEVGVLFKCTPADFSFEKYASVLVTSIKFDKYAGTAFQRISRSRGSARTEKRQKEIRNMSIMD